MYYSVLFVVHVYDAFLETSIVTETKHESLKINSFHLLWAV
jgi:hypothetical protein